MPSPLKRRVTSLDVARLAGVSQSAVSRAFTAGASISDTVRGKVLAAAAKLSYRPNAIARTLSTRRSRIIGVVMSYLENQFYPLVLERISALLQQRGYHVLMFIQESAEADPLLEEILGYSVDGLILASTALSSNLALQCAEAGIPVIYFNRVSTKADSSSVTSDNYEGGRMAAEFLIETGHRRIAFVAGLENSSTSLARELGMNDGLANGGQRCFARAVGHYDFDRAKSAARELFKHGAFPDAVFVANDHMGIAVIDTIREEMSLRIPDDVSVVGFDNIPQAAWGAYKLTTIEQSVERMVRATVDLLAELLSAPEPTPRHIVVPCHLIIRCSARKSPRASQAPLG